MRAVNTVKYFQHKMFSRKMTYLKNMFQQKLFLRSPRVSMILSHFNKIFYVLISYWGLNNKSLAPFRGKCMICITLRGHGAVCKKVNIYTRLRPVNQRYICQKKRKDYKSRISPDGDGDQSIWTNWVHNFCPHMSHIIEASRL